MFNTHPWPIGGVFNGDWSLKRAVLGVSSCVFVFPHFEDGDLRLSELRGCGAAGLQRQLFYQLSSSLEATKLSFPELRLVSVTRVSLAEDTWSQICQPDGIVSELQISSPGQANANQFMGGVEDVVTKPAFFTSASPGGPSAKLTSVQPWRRRKTSSPSGHHRFTVLMDALDTNSAVRNTDTYFFWWGEAEQTESAAEVLIITLVRPGVDRTRSVAVETPGCGCSRDKRLREEDTSVLSVLRSWLMVQMFLILVFE